VTLQEALEAIGEAGAHLDVDEVGPILRGRVPAAVVETLRANRDRVAAVLQLRDIHRAMGFDEADVEFIEKALLSGKVNEIRIVSRPPSEPAA
jgi:hypothetical protein